MAHVSRYCFIIVALLPLVGCSRSSPEPVADSGQSTDAPPSAANASSPGAESTQASPAKKLGPDAEKRRETDRRVAFLAREIDGHRRRGYDAQAVAAREEMLQIFEATYGKNSWQVRSANLALWREKRLATFSPAQREANEAAEKRTREANELWQKGEHKAALQAIAAARQMAIKVWGADTYGIANLLDQEARWQQAAGDPATAEKTFRQALKIREQVFTREHPETISSCSALGRLLQALQKRDEAATLLSRAVEDAGKVWGEGHPDYAGHLNNLALLYLEMGQPQQAAELLTRAAHVWSSALGEKHPVVGEAYLNLGRAWYSIQNYAQAEQPLSQSLAILEPIFGAKHPATRRARVTLGLTRLALGKYKGAETLLRADLEILQKDFGDEHPETAEGIVRLAILYGNQGRYQEALPLAERAAKLHRAAAGPDNPLTRNAEAVATLVRDGMSRSAGGASAATPTPAAGGGVRANFEQPIRR